MLSVEWIAVINAVPNQTLKELLYEALREPPDDELRLISLTTLNPRR